MEAPIPENLLEVIQQLQAKLKRRNEQNKQSVKNYREKHREAINQSSLEYYKKKKEDTEWLKQLRERQKVYQKARRKSLKETLIKSNDVIPTP